MDDIFQMWPGSLSRFKKFHWVQQFWYVREFDVNLWARERKYSYCSEHLIVFSVQCRNEDRVKMPKEAMKNKSHLKSVRKATRPAFMYLFIVSTKYENGNGVERLPENSRSSKKFQNVLTYHLVKCLMSNGVILPQLFLNVDLRLLENIPEIDSFVVWGKHCFELPFNGNCKPGRWILRDKDLYKTDLDASKGLTSFQKVLKDVSKTFQAPTLTKSVIRKSFQQNIWISTYTNSQNQRGNALQIAMLQEWKTEGKALCMFKHLENKNCSLISSMIL